MTPCVFDAQKYEPYPVKGVMLMLPAREAQYAYDHAHEDAATAKPGRDTKNFAC